MSRSIRWLALSLSLIVLSSISAIADSHARIVRLSSVDGTVQVDRGNGGVLQRASLNTPIVEGTRLITSSDGLAEVEFENETALRLTSDSEVKFSQLLMSDTGVKMNQFEVIKGLVYLDTASKGADLYRVKVGDTSLVAHRDTLLRLSVTPDQLQVAVFHGELQLENQPQPVYIGKKETLTVELNEPSRYAVAKGADAVRFDAWNKEREDYSRTYAQNAGYGGPNRGYGLQDLNYYGDFFYAGGYGYVWQPYGFAGSMLGWDPYSNGTWSFYPGMGYAWTSAYPWGWLPYHYGSWAFINGAGWAWVPGRGYNGQWYANNFAAVPRITRAPAGWTAAVPPPVPAAAAAPPTVLVGTTTPNAVTVPGGRIPPNFASLVPGRAVATQGFVKPNASAKGPVFAAPNATAGAAHQGHVFAAPARSVSLAAGPEIGSLGGRPSGISSSAHPGVSSASAHSSGGAAHK